MKSIKKALIVDAAILLGAVLLFAYTTFAYFTDSQHTSSVITSGNVAITLSESQTKRDSMGNLVQDLEKPRIFGTEDQQPHDYGIVYPGQSIYKDPTIKNTGSEPAYVAAKITVTDGRGDIHRILGDGAYEEIDITLLLSGGLLGEVAHFGTWNGIDYVTYNDRFAMVQIPSASEGKYEFYFFILEPIDFGETVLLFDGIHFDPDYTQEDMNEFIDLRIDVWGFGVQTFGFESCFDAMVNALPAHFGAFSHSAP